MVYILTVLVELMVLKITLIFLKLIINSNLVFDRSINNKFTTVSAINEIRTLEQTDTRLVDLSNYNRSGQLGNSEFRSRYHVEIG